MPIAADGRLYVPRDPSNPYSSLGIRSPEEMAKFERLKQSQFFLFRNGRQDDDPGRCKGWGGRKGCGAKHQYLTLGCIERPFNGLVEGLYGFVVSTTNRELAAIIDPMIGRLETSHPFTANRLRPDELGEDLICWSLTLAVEIDRDKAYALAEAINGMGLNPPLVLEPPIMPRMPNTRGL